MTGSREVRDAQVAGLEGSLTIVDVRTPSADWDSFVESRPEGTFCHRAGWAGIMSGVMGHTCHFLEARDEGGTLTGVLPLVRVRSLLFGDFLVSMPFFNYGGPLGEPEISRVLADHAAALAGRLGCELLELRSRHAFPSELEVNARKVLVLLPLPEDPETLWNDGFKSKLRTKLRRAEKEGFEVRCGHHLVEDFYGVLARNMRDLGSPVLDFRLFKAILEQFGDDVGVYVTYLGDTPVASAMGFYDRDEFELTWSSALSEYNRHNPNMWMYWNIMRDVILNGRSTFNFGRSTPGGGTHAFKLSWGGHDEPLPWQIHAPAARSAPPTPDDKGFSLAIKAWQKLPVAVANRIGPILSRRLP